MFDNEKLSQSDEEMLELDFDLEVPTHNDEDLDELNKILEVEESVPLEPIKMRFIPVPSQQKIDTIAMARTEQTTNRQTTWGVKLFRGWLKENNLQTDFEMTDVSTLNERLKIFYASLQTKNGEEYSKSALIGIRAALSRHLTSPPYNREISLMKDREFMTSNHVMLGLVKIIKREGRDVTIHKKAVSKGDIEKLYSSEVFNLDSPETLQNKVFWHIMLNFGRRGQEGLHSLKKSSYAKFTDDVGRSFYKMTYNESNKTQHGIDNR
ncbi:Hypothetical predicted protein [Mytilus galloprovincialis]|uniref:DUF3504 domain-containing protein n=1 Tax=Mytilus galloprovincialis TaxID=29158 RepID=A0A8B6BN89_MYTGA|nr:Hypothetical predicted protein [Mytilus galloprovincialis]